jgi:DNA-binding beta-propeller fold protein YncE
MRTFLILIFSALIAAASRAEVTGNKTFVKSVQSVPLPGVKGRIDHMAVDPKGKRLFVAALGNGSLEFVDIAAGKVVASITGLQEPQGISFMPEFNRLAVACGGDGSVRFYDGTTFNPVKTLDFKDDADNLRYDPVAKLLYVGYGAGGLGVIDAAKLEKIENIPLANHPESFQLESKGNRIFVNLPGSKEVAVIDRSKSAVIAHWPLMDAAANFPIALDEANHRLFVACRQPAKMLVLDTDTGKQTASADIAGDCDDLFYDPARKYAYASGGAGSLTILAQEGPDTYTPLADVKTAPGARTSFFARDLGLLFVAVPLRAGQKCELRLFRTDLASHGATK